MARKIKVRLKITGLELDFEGTQDDVPQVGRNLGQAISNLLTAGPNLAGGQIPTVTVNAQDNGTPAGGGRRSPNRARRSGTKEDKRTVKWAYDGQAYGLPRQSWSGNDKAIWILYVAEKTLNLNRMGASQIANTFNEHYQAAKRIHRGNVYNGLDALRSSEKTPVGKTDDGMFFLTEEGYKVVEKLINNPQAEANP